LLSCQSQRMGSCYSKVAEPPSRRADKVAGPEPQHPTQTPTASTRSTRGSALAPASDGNPPAAPEKSSLRKKVRQAVDYGVKAVTPNATKSVKTEAEIRLIRDSLQKTTVLGALPLGQLTEMIGLMGLKLVHEGQVVGLTNGLYVVLEGAVVIEGGGSVWQQAGSLLGEQQLLYERLDDTPLRARAVTAKTKMAHLRRDTFQQHMEGARRAKLEQNMALISSIGLFDGLSVAERFKLADACKNRGYSIDDRIIKQGEAGSEFFILLSGSAKVYRAEGAGVETCIDNKYAGDCFGEQALLSDQPRSATIVAADHGTEVLCIDKNMFDSLLGQLGGILERHEAHRNELMMVEVEIFRHLSATTRAQLLARMERVSFANEDFVFRQGEYADKMYIIKSGEVEVLVGTPGGGIPPLQKIDHLVHGRCFGERALVRREPRMAHIRAKGALECLTISKADFDELALAEQTSYWESRWEKEETRDPSHFKVVRSLGAGAFGTAYLVQHRSHPERMYALKALPKDSTRMRVCADAVLREKDILASLPISFFVVTLHNAFQCPDYLYMLMDLAPGGELYQIMANNTRFHPLQARFYMACIVLAIEHLHRHNVIFRDLKPENLLIDRKGYLKLIDMGFARRLRADEKAYTLCGTPYYLAPEMIQHLGHDKGLDWWSVGVISFEMIDGSPPFLGGDEMEVYDKVLKLNYSYDSDAHDAAAGSYFCADSKDLIRRLICLEPSRRLGNLRDGAEDIKNHRWFTNPTPVVSSSGVARAPPSFDWKDLAFGPNGPGRMKPPYVPNKERLRKLTSPTIPQWNDKKLLSMKGIQTTEADKEHPGWIAGWSSFTM